MSPTPASALMRRVVSFARSPQGRRAMESAVRYARSDKGKQQIAAGRKQVAAARERVNRARTARRPPP
jgi:hypothetical protein